MRPARSRLRPVDTLMAVILFTGGCALGLNCGGTSGGQARVIKQTYTDENGKTFEAIVATTPNSFGVPSMLRFDAICPTGPARVEVPISDVRRTDTVSAKTGKAEVVVVNTERRALVNVRCLGTGTRLKFVFDKGKISEAIESVSVSTSTSATTTTTSPTTTPTTTESSESTTTGSTESSP